MASRRQSLGDVYDVFQEIIRTFSITQYFTEGNYRGFGGPFERRGSYE